MRAAIIILSSLVFFALCFSVEAKVPTIPLQFNATLQFRFHGSDVVGQIFQDRQKLNRTRVQASGGRLQGNSIYDVMVLKSYNFGNNHDCYVTPLSPVTVLLLTWDWLRNATSCQASPNTNCYNYQLNRGQVTIWFDGNGNPTAYQFSDGGEQFSFKITSWNPGPQNPSHFQLPGSC